MAFTRFGIQTPDDQTCGLPVSLFKISQFYDEICEVMKYYWPDLLPTEEEREKRFGEYFKIIKDFCSEVKTPSYSHEKCTARFLIATILVCLKADKGYFEPIPEQSFYHSGQRAKSISLYDLLKSNHYSTFKIAMISILFEAVNKGLSGNFDAMVHSCAYGKYYYEYILNHFIQIQKENPKEGLVRLYDVTNDLLGFADFWYSQTADQF